MKRKHAVGVALLLCFFVPAAPADRLDFERDRMRSILKVVSRDIEKNFYDETLKGLDWPALTEQARQRIDKAKSVSEMVTAIFGLVDKLQDSHTKFLPPGRVARPRFGFEAMAFGDEVRLFRVKKKGAAAEAGLQVGDRLLTVNGYDAERNSFDLMMLFYRFLRPAPELRITFSRGSDPPQTVRLQAKVKTGTMIEDLTDDLNIWKYIREWDEQEKHYCRNFDDGIGYLQIASFDVEEITVAHLLEKPRAVLVDLRGNGGGAADTLAEFIGHFEAREGSAAEHVGRKKTEPLKFKQQKPNFAVPLVILVDSQSASASEMFARYFQRIGRAVVVGDRTSGRVNGSRFISEHIGADTIVPFGVQVSVARVVMADGEELEKRGVTPDVHCLPNSDDLRERRDPCLLQALSIARKQAGLGEDLSLQLKAQAGGLVAEIEKYRESEYQRDRD